MHIFHVIPDTWGPYVDIRAMWQALACRRKHVRVLTPEQFLARSLDDDRDVFVCWELIDPGRRDGRKAMVLQVYAEAMDDDVNNMLPAHRDHWQRLKDIAPNLDGVLTHTPWTADFVRRYVNVQTDVMPVGWDPEVMGSPRWEAPKHHDLAYHGSMVGRRELVVPYIAGKFGRRFVEATGLYGRALLGRLDQSSTSLYISHSDVTSFSTWRTWQVASTSAILIVEGRAPGTAGDGGFPHDTWPLEGGLHYLQIPSVLAGADAAIAELEKCVHPDTHAARIEMARRVHEEIARLYTVDYVTDKFLIPAIERMRS